MSYLLRCWKKLLYLLVTGSTSMFIAACYGPPAGYFNYEDWTIKTKNNNNEPIAGLEVRLIRKDGNAGASDTVDARITDSTGAAHFRLFLSEGNNFFVNEAIIHDSDGNEHGGSFVDTVLTYDGVGESVVKMRMQ